MDKKPLRISVVTIARNAARDLPLTIESAIGQDYPQLETIVVDGQSWDDTAAVLRRYRPLVDSIIVREDAGIYPAMNAALADVTGDYVIFLNAGDQFFGADAVSRMVRGMIGRPDIFYGNHVYVTGRSELFRRSAPFAWLADTLRAGTIGAAWHEAIPGHQATFASAALLRQLRYDTRLRVAADHEFLFCAYAAGAVMHYVDETVAHYHAGGFSISAGELTRIEGASVYRRFSDNPAAVDRYFYPEGTPFLPQTARTGFQLAGFLPSDGQPVDWVSGGGCSLMAPGQPSHGLALAGINRIAGQAIELACDDQVVGTAELPEAHFRIEMAFTQGIAPASVLTIRPRHAAQSGQGASAAFALRSFQFLTAGTHRTHRLIAGETFHFRNGAGPALADMMGSGWSASEEALTWSLGRRSDIWLGLDDALAELALDIGGNPHVEGRVQKVELIVNGVQVDEIRLIGGERRTMTYDVRRQPWARGGINHVQFLLDRSSPPPAGSGDMRDLGICLWSVGAG